ncbi:MAG TPA: hypothetical protein VN253_11140 [Kofleriaceae bacterium]|nr:hypothetical protein [Kofleriaceae bacterium]
MKKLILFALLASACGGNDKATPDPTPDAPPVDNRPPCFSGTPQTHDQLINACVDQSVTRIVKYADLPAMRQARPLLNSDGSLPPLP